MIVELTKSFHALTRAEQIEYFEKLGKRILVRRYEYYVLDHPMISDWEYDYIESYYEAIGQYLNLPTVIKDMVGYDISHPVAAEVADIIEAGKVDQLYQN